MKLNQKYICTGNRESDNGRFGIVAKQRTRWELAFILESKVSDKVTDLLSDAREVAKKTTEKEYFKELQQEGYEKIMCYGISICQKRCRVVQGETYTVHGLSGQ
ncbi:MAG: PD-(D/E)XK nuclease domain-containing protein [Clostridia bacterium]|nr:PD-(D/E)XK nuclease domain-containing protein [Clostridia bacterium]